MVQRCFLSSLVPELQSKRHIYVRRGLAPYLGPAWRASPCSSWPSVRASGAAVPASAGAAVVVLFIWMWCARRGEGLPAQRGGGPRRVLLWLQNGVRRGVGDRRGRAGGPGPGWKEHAWGWCTRSARAPWARADGSRAFQLGCLAGASEHERACACAPDSRPARAAWPVPSCVCSMRAPCERAAQRADDARASVRGGQGCAGRPGDSSPPRWR